MKKMIFALVAVSGTWSVFAPFTMAAESRTTKPKPKVTAKQYQNLLDANRRQNERIIMLENTFDALFMCLNPVWDLGIMWDTMVGPLYPAGFEYFGAGNMLAIGIDPACVAPANSKGAREFILPGRVYGG
jgi:hypothetical protein